jgi:hypothetical protein
MEDFNYIEYLKNNLLLENEGTKYQVIFYDDYTETPVKQLFNSKEEAEKWADDLEYDFQDIVINDRGDDEWKTFYKFHNPEDKEVYNGYKIKPINSLNESQKNEIRQEMSSLLKEAKKRTEIIKQQLRREGYNV